MDKLLAISIAKWGTGNDSRIAQIQEWQDAALQEIVNGNGRNVVSTSANSVSVQFASGQSNSDFFNTLTAALDYINNGFQTNTKIGLIR